MKRDVATARAAVLATALGLIGASASAHRIDEYLQATLLSVEADRIEVSMRLIPGKLVAQSVIAAIDSNADGAFSAREQQAYAKRVMRDLSITVDGHDLAPSLVSWQFPVATALRGGLGEVHIDYVIDTPAASGDRALVLTNRHLGKQSAYLMNTLEPRNPDIHVLAQKRNPRQSRYELDYRQGPAGLVAAIPAIPAIPALPAQPAPASTHAAQRQAAAGLGP